MIMRNYKSLHVYARFSPLTLNQRVVGSSPTRLTGQNRFS
jgi:hypothetical protein